MHYTIFIIGTLLVFFGFGLTIAEDSAIRAGVSAIIFLSGIVLISTAMILRALNKLIAFEIANNKLLNSKYKHIASIKYDFNELGK